MPTAHHLRWMVLICLTIFLAAGVASAEERTRDGKLQFERRVRPVLAKHCLRCHGADDPEADLRLDTLTAVVDHGADAETWHDVLNKLNLGEMPPEDAEPISDKERDALVDWITEEIRLAAQQRKNAGGRIRLRRLTRYEYNNTMRDLLGVNLDFSSDLPPDSSSQDGFKNNAAVLDISPLQMEMYLAAVRRGLRQAIVLGPEPEFYSHRAEKSADGKKKKKPTTSNRLDRTSRFMTRMLEFPREGEILVRVRATAIVPENAPLPRMRVSLGLRADVRAPEKDLGEVDLLAIDGPQTFEFRGRIEDFPLPGHNPKFPGLQIAVYNQFDGKAPPKKKQPKPKLPKGQRPKRVRRDNADQLEPPSQDPIIMIESVEFEGPIVDAWPPSSHTAILFEGQDRYDDESAYTAEVIRRFVERAYRRAPRKEDVEVLLGLYGRLRPKYETLEETLQEVLAFALISPDFLYLVEPNNQDAKAVAISDHELASRLSYFLWSSMPDEQLFELAGNGTLRDDKVLAKQVERMLLDPRSRQFVRHFSEQWLDLSAVDRVAVNPEFHPDFDDKLKADMRKESELLFAVVLDENLSALTFLDSDFTMLNRRLANHYGIKGPRGLAFERVALKADEDRRGGLLTNGSFLLANSNGEDSHPIKRAVWLLDRLLASPPAPPPPDVPELDPTQADLAGLSLKEQLEAHRTKPACNSCHRRIDPWGIAFENYDAVGRWREKLNTAPKAKTRKQTQNVGVDASAVLPDGTQIDGVTQLKAHLLTTEKRRFAEALVKRLLGYGIGRSLDWSDQPEVELLTDDFESNEYRLRELLIAIVNSKPFQSK